MNSTQEEYKKATQKWMFPIEQSIKELRDLLRNDVKQAVTEALLDHSVKSEKTADINIPTEFLTIDQASILLHVSKPTLHRYRRELGFEISRIGRRVLFNKKDLEKVIQVKSQKRRV